MASTVLAPEERVSLKRLLWVGPLTIVVAAVANSILRFLAVSLFTISPDFVQLQVGPPIMFSVVGVLGAVIVFALIARFSRRPIRLFRTVALVVLLISFLPDIGLLATGSPGATPLSIGVLMLMHVVASGDQRGLADAADAHIISSYWVGLCYTNAQDFDAPTPSTRQCCGGRYEVTMTTITPQTAALVDSDATDPYRYGWRYVQHARPDGGIQVEQVPLTLEDLLHPEEGDHVTHSRDHELFRKYIANVLESRLQNDPSAAVLIDVRIAWDVPGLKPHGPDLAVVFGVREQRNWSTFTVADEDVRPSLIIEITSPETRHLDLYEKVDEYELAGVPLYIIVETYTVRRITARRLKGYRFEDGMYTVLAPDARGWLWIEPVGIWIGIREQRVECYDAAGHLIGDYVAIDAARIMAENRAAVEAKARAKAEQRAADEAKARVKAEQHAAATEARLQALEAELRRLRGEG